MAQVTDISRNKSVRAEVHMCKATMAIYPLTYTVLSYGQSPTQGMTEHDYKQLSPLVGCMSWLTSVVNLIYLGTKELPPGVGMSVGAFS